MSETMRRLGGVVPQIRLNPRQTFVNGTMELHRILSNRTADEWSKQAVLATAAILPQLVNTELGARAVFTTEGQMALALTAGMVAEGLLQASGYLAVMANRPEFTAARSLVD